MRALTNSVEQLLKEGAILGVVPDFEGLECVNRPAKGKIGLHRCPVSVYINFSQETGDSPAARNAHGSLHTSIHYLLLIHNPEYIRCRVHLHIKQSASGARG